MICLPPKDSFTESCETHYPAVLRFARRRADEDTARHAAEETLLAAWQAWERLPAEPLPWLYGTARNQLVTAHRAAERRSRTERRAADEPRPHQATAEEAITDAAPVRQAMSRLGPDDQELLRLAYWEGLPARDIATVLGKGAGAVAIRLHRARRRLAAHLDDEPEPQAAQDLRPAASCPGTQASAPQPTPTPARLALEDR